ncbi:hypothetical protein [Gordonia alkanivorans]|uniref:Pullulanase n=1 Tax=Gordonia alkanivorans CGMCC 6845 TaxID=1423140 RepID=W9DIC9_9ACTN|nr:hypothetical protein [Gordonia alkanivorans]ETA08234.1 hypothetical protein V525_03980 [Gordonia alkanivorans CGMCC 6845]MDH3006167.1 hypothetical protein [Gordonia alkanivorans]MDH3012802.1 hypothetical protein [Gordonia alkanivorans]MDH3015922.1 hypothetical protein [Gordonia alkanivorans]MDH3021725.1 hypothetical protein [Gordonia alkanivorans]
MDPVIEYFFGPGDGSTTRWSTPADTALGDSGPDAVRLDFDGDGRRDDAMWDTDGDGIADVAALDTDEDGEPDAFYRDSGAGLWDRAVDRVGVVGESDSPEVRSPEADGSGEPDGPRDLRLDLDADGATDIELVGAEKGGRLTAERLYVDTDGDGVTDTVLVDLNGDGVADAAYDKRDPRFTRRGR